MLRAIIGPGQTPVSAMPLSKYHRWRTPVFALAVLLQIGVGLATAWGVRALERSTAWVEHTYEVLGQIETTLASFHAAAAAARGYRLSGHDALETEFATAAPAAAREFGILVSLTDDNPTQRKRAEEIRHEALAAVGKQQRLVEARAAGISTRESEAAGLQDRLQQMEHIDSLLRSMRQDELRLLADRRHASEHRVALLFAAVGAGQLVSLSLLSLLLVGLVRENRRSRELEHETLESAARVEAASALGERLSEQRRALSVYAGLLQSCQNLDEAMQVTASTLEQLVPGLGGRCYVGRPSQDFFETAAHFGRDSITSTDVLRTGDCWALRRGSSHRADGRSGGMRCRHMDAGGSMAGLAALCVPLVAQGETLGLLHANGVGDGGPGDNDVQLLESLGEHLSMAMANLRLRETLRVQSLRDPLTGLFNRRYLEENLQRELQRCERRGLPLSVVMMDIDHFKRFNDQHGHAAGDAVLAQVGRILQSLVRGEDLACRYGGEEFTLVLPETDAAIAVQRAETIRTALAGSSIVHLQKTLGPVTISAGVATFPHDGTTPEVLFEVADALLYRAKASGRNRVMHAGDAA